MTSSRPAATRRRNRPRRPARTSPRSSLPAEQRRPAAPLPRSKSSARNKQKRKPPKNVVAGTSQARAPGPNKAPAVHASRLPGQAWQTAQGEHGHTKAPRSRTPRTPESIRRMVPRRSRPPTVTRPCRRPKADVPYGGAVGGNVRSRAHEPGRMSPVSTPEGWK